MSTVLHPRVSSLLCSAAASDFNLKCCDLLGNKKGRKEIV